MTKKWTNRNTQVKKQSVLKTKQKASRLNKQWSSRLQKPQSVVATINANSQAGMERLFSQDSFAAGMQEAYSNKEGYVIATNPTTGEKEMFIAGTRTAGQWALNLFDVVGARVDYPRQKQVAIYQEIANREGVDVVYGHSRAAALVSDMDIPGIKKVGVDGAMSLAYQDRDMVNYHEGGLTGAFDELIALGGKNNRRMNLGSHIHSIWS